VKTYVSLKEGDNSNSNIANIASAGAMGDESIDCRQGYSATTGPPMELMKAMTV